MTKDEELQELRRYKSITQKFMAEIEDKLGRAICGEGELDGQVIPLTGEIPTDMLPGMAANILTVMPEVCAGYMKYFTTGKAYHLLDAIIAMDNSTAVLAKAELEAECPGHVYVQDTTCSLIERYVCTECGSSRGSSPHHSKE